jgi:HD-like signal output (HDOD) protein
MDLETLRLIVRRTENLPVFPSVAQEVLRIAELPTVSSGQVEHLICHDAGLMAKILKVASSPMYGVKDGMSVERAVSFLGTTQVRKLVLQVSLQQMVRGGTYDVEEQAWITETWRHCMAVAIIARAISDTRDRGRQDDYFTAGMLHDLGMIFLYRTLRDRYNSSLGHARTCGVNNYRAEFDLLGFTHADIGWLMVQTYGLNSRIEESVRYHHDPGASSDHYLSACILHVADVLAHRAGFENHQDHVEHEIVSYAKDEIALSDEETAAIVDLAKKEVSEMESSLENLHAA